MKTIAYYRLKKGIGRGVHRHMGYDDNEDWVFAVLFDDKMTWSVRKVDVLKKYDKEENFDIEKYKPLFTCRERINQAHLLRDTDVDYYDDEGTCSYCGSERWITFLKCIEIAATNAETDNNDYSLEKATGKNYKYYFTIPENRNCKFYIWHVPQEIVDNSELLASLNSLLHIAITASNKKFMAQMNIKHKED